VAETAGFLEDFKADEPEVKKLKVCATSTNEPQNDIMYRLVRRYSSFVDLQRSVAWLLRYRQFLRARVNKSSNPQRGPLTCMEMANATMAIVRVVQKEVFSQALNVLHNHADFSSPVTTLSVDQLKKHPSLRELQRLSPYLVDGVLRVGGRLQHSQLPTTAKHPVLLPSKPPVTDLLILDCHVREGHMGASYILNSLYNNFWILKGKAAVKKALRLCYSCKFWKAGIGKEQMAPCLYTE